MDYTIFAKENHNLTTLNCMEINDPLTGLKEFLIEKSANQFKQDVRDILFAVYEKHGWRQFGAPINLYVKAKGVAKLMEFVWLIVSCEVSTQRKEISLNKHYLSEQYRHRTFTKLFHETPSRNKAKMVSAVSLASAIFKERFGLLLKENLEENWLDVALNSSYMRNLVADFHCIDSSVDWKDHQYVMAIIDAAFELANQSTKQLDPQVIKYYQLFAIDVDHPNRLFEEQIELLYESLNGIFWYIDVVKFPKAIRMWFSMISKANHWKDHNDPGNFLYIKESIQHVIETGWLQLRVGFPKLNNRRIKQEYVKDLSALEIDNPLDYVRYFFEQRRLYEWKQLLEIWLCQSLSNENHQDTEVTKKDCENIIKFIQALWLIEHRTK